ncbi:MAG: esterase [Anaerolineaceae bacterium]|nr:esterase [Anaerolineaceae bacterium]
MLKTLARLIGLSTVLVGWLNRTEITRPAQLALFMPKIIAGATAPLAVVGGALAALVGWLRKDRLALLTGTLGAVLAVRHIRRVTAAHDQFERTFGDGWRARIPPELHAHMLPRRYNGVFPDPEPVIYLRDQVIGTTPETGKPLLGDLWKPPMWVDPTGLAIIYLHGSGWHYGDKDFGTRLLIQHLAAQGHVVLDLAYSLAPGINLYGMVGDVKRAIGWVKAHAAEHGINPERMVLMGASAGGHLALLTAYAADHPAFETAGIEAGESTVRGVVSYYGPCDAKFFYDYAYPHFGGLLGGKTPLSKLTTQVSASLLRAYERSLKLPTRLRLQEVGIMGPDQMIARVLGGTPDDVPDVYAAASPISHVGPHCPPTLLLTGAHDLVMKPSMGRRLHEALCEKGVQAAYIELPDTDHGLDLYAQRIAPAFHATTYDVERFLALLI